MLTLCPAPGRLDHADRARAGDPAAAARHAGYRHSLLASGGDGEYYQLNDASSLTLAMHMLYHVPEPLEAARELRRITHPGGQVLVVLNGEDHLRELRGPYRRRAARHYQ